MRWIANCIWLCLWKNEVGNIYKWIYEITATPIINKSLKAMMACLRKIAQNLINWSVRFKEHLSLFHFLDAIINVLFNGDLMANLMNLSLSVLNSLSTHYQWEPEGSYLCTPQIPDRWYFFRLCRARESFRFSGVQRYSALLVLNS